LQPFTAFLFKVNISYSKNKILYMDEIMPNYPWMAQTGQSTGTKYGLIFDRFLRASDFDAEGNMLPEDEDGKPIPTMSIGNPRPGDALFKDLNDDGKITADECVIDEHVKGLGTGWVNSVNENFEIAFGCDGSKIVKFTPERFTEKGYPVYAHLGEPIPAPFVHLQTSRMAPLIVLLASSKPISTSRRLISACEFATVFSR
jgi:hypothetical protein